MKTQVLILIFGILFISCEDKGTEIKGKPEQVPDVQNVLSYVDTSDKIEISQTDDKYGEWGGDSDIIHIYSDGKNILADYSRYLGSRKPPMPPKENEKPKKWYEYKELELKIDSIKLNTYEKELIELVILDLVKHKINNRSTISHSGIYNSIISKDSSLIIEDYPSNRWEPFQKLKNELKKK